MTYGVVVHRRVVTRGRVFAFLGSFVVALGFQTVEGLAQTADSVVTACQGAGQTTQTQDLQPHAHTVDARATVRCPVGKADGAIDPRAFGQTYTRPRWRVGSTAPEAPPPAKDTPCLFSNAYASGVSLDPPGPNRMAHWTPPDPTMQSSAGVTDGSSLPAPSDGLIISENLSRVAGQFRFKIHYDYQGTYNGTDWECRGQYVHSPGSPCWDDGRAGPVLWCVAVEPVGIIAPALANPPDPTTVPEIRAQLAEMSKTTNGGRIGTSPADPTRQFVALPSCWWINGLAPQTAFEVTIDAPPNADGRGLTYVYRVTVGLEKVHWDYGDGSSWDGNAGSPYDSNGTCTNPHTYTRVSAIGNHGAVPCPAGYPHPSADDGCYQVQASETYSVSVTAYWNDNSGDYRGHPMAAQAPFTIPATDVFVRALQIEGIPVAG